MSESTQVDLTNYDNADLLVFTEAAANKVKNLIEEEKNDSLKLRVFVSGGGCSGFKYDFTFDKILIAGLGLGLVPNYAKVVKNCSVIDVIENNSELISYVDYLDDSINIIEDDAFNYTPNKTYDLILFDLWWNESDITEEIQNSIREKYSSRLSEEGKIIIPLLSKQL